jgi:hypothetical protein
LPYRRDDSFLPHSQKLRRWYPISRPWQRDGKKRSLELRLLGVIVFEKSLLA